MEPRYAAAYPELYARHWWWRVREEIVLRRIRDLLSGTAGARLLDVGCGAALFFDALEPLAHVEGIESDADAVAHSGRWRARIHVGSLDAGFKPPAPYDLILMLDVLEHMPDPDAALRRAGELLAPGGHILLTVPAFAWLWTAHDDMNHHLRRYSAAQIRAAMSRAGLTPLETCYLFQSLVMPKLLVRAKEAIAGRRQQVPRVPPRAANAAIQQWFRVEHAALGWLPFGGSLLAIAGPAPRGAESPPSKGDGSKG